MKMEKLYLFLFRRNDRVHRIKQNSKTVVSYFQNRRWRLITLVEKLSASWPYQRKLKQCPLQFVYFFFYLPILSAAVNKLIQIVGVDSDLTIECCITMIFLIALFVKTVLTLIHQFNRRKIYEKIAKHFETISDPEEAAILNEAAEHGFKYALVYMGTLSMMIGLYGGIPILRAFYEYFFNHCELNVQMPVPMDFGFDHGKYWYIIAVDFIMWVNTGTVSDFAYDLSFILQVHHAAALFQIVGIRLRKASNLVDESENETMSNEATDESFSLISSAIDLHSDCFEVVKLIEKSYSTTWFLVLLLSTAGVGAGVHLLTTKLHDPIEAFRYFSGFFLIMVHFQMIFFQGQKIINSSSKVADECCECKWYGLPKKSRQLLWMMMIRTSMPCTLTGSKLFILSMETYAKMLKAGLSYYTVYKSRS